MQGQRLREFNSSAFLGFFLLTRQSHSFKTMAHAALRQKNWTVAERAVQLSMPPSVGRHPL